MITTNGSLHHDEFELCYDMHKHLPYIDECQVALGSLDTVSRTEYLLHEYGHLTTRIT